MVAGLLVVDVGQTWHRAEEGGEGMMERKLLREMEDEESAAVAGHLLVGWNEHHCIFIKFFPSAGTEEKHPPAGGGGRKKKRSTG